MGFLLVPHGYFVSSYPYVETPNKNNSILLYI